MRRVAKFGPRSVVAICLLMLVVTIGYHTLLPSYQPVDWQSQLKSSFRQHYDSAIEVHETHLYSKYPIIVQDFLNMTLIRSSGERERFRMKKDVYFALAHNSHIPLAVYSILAPDGFDVGAAGVREKLESYLQILEASHSELIQLAESVHQRERLLKIVATSIRYVREILEVGWTSREDFKAYIEPLHPLIRESLREGAAEQLEQFRAKMDDWRAEFPEETWSELRVVVLGFHQMRELHARREFFRWLLREPTYEEKVVFAEFQFPVFGDQRQRAEKLALELLTKVDFEKGVGAAIFDDPIYMQSDVMGPAAVEILKSWGPSHWPEEQ